MVNQVIDTYQGRGEKMVTYLEKAKELVKAIPMASIEVISWSKNTNVDALAKLTSTKDVELLNLVSVEFLAKPSKKWQPKVIERVHEPLWMNPVIAYLKERQKLESWDWKQYITFSVTTSYTEEATQSHSWSA